MPLSLKQKSIKARSLAGLLATTVSVWQLFDGISHAQEAPADLTIVTNPTRNASDIRADSARNAGGTLEQVFPEDISQPLGDPSSPANPLANDDADSNDSDAPVTGLRGAVDRDETPRRNQRVRRADQVGIIGPDGAITPLANSRQPAEQGGNFRQDDDPFAALGLRVGSFTLYPVLTQSFGYTTNADFAADGEKSGFSQTDIRVRAESNWSRHQLRGEIGGDYEAFFNGSSEDLPNIDGELELRLDLSQNWALRFGAVANLTTESATSNNVTVPAPLVVDERPKLAVYGGYVEIDRQAGRLDTRLRGTITRSQYDDAKLSDGSSHSQDDRTNNLYQLTARVGFDSTPSFQPFVEGSIGRRDYKLSVDSNGDQRTSTLGALRAGIVFDRGEKLNGEFSVGYAREEFDKGTLDPLDGITVNAAVNWSPHRFTTISSTIQTQFNESSDAGESGSVTYAGTFGVTRDVRADFALNARALASLRSYEGSGRDDRTYQIQAGAEWRLSRMMAILGNIGYENVDSTDATSSYDAVTARVGFRLQR